MNGRSWPNAPIDEPWLNGRYRGIAAVGSVKLNGSKVSISVFASKGISTQLNNVRQVEFRLGQFSSTLVLLYRKPPAI